MNDVPNSGAGTRTQDFQRMRLAALLLAYPAIALKGFEPLFMR